MRRKSLSEVVDKMKTAATTKGGDYDVAASVRGGSTTKICVWLVGKLTNAANSVTEENPALREMTANNILLAHTAREIETINPVMPLANDVSQGTSALKENRRLAELGHAIEVKAAPVKAEAPQRDDELAKLKERSKSIISGQHHLMTDVVRELEAGKTPEEVAEKVTRMAKEQNDLSKATIKQAANSESVQIKLEHLRKEIGDISPAAAKPTTTEEKPISRPE